MSDVVVKTLGFNETPGLLKITVNILMYSSEVLSAHSITVA